MCCGLAVRSAKYGWVTVWAFNDGPLSGDIYGTPGEMRILAHPLLMMGLYCDLVYPRCRTDHWARKRIFCAERAVNLLFQH